MDSIDKSWLPIFGIIHSFVADTTFGKYSGSEYEQALLGPAENHSNIIETLSENIYPPKNQVFRVFEMPLEDIQILLLGQDPYHGYGQAHGLSFSVCDGTKIPHSLKNIYKELKRQFPERNYIFNSGNLEKWFSREKIFLLNAALTVIDGRPGSHMNIWKDFTNNVIKYIAEKNNKCIFLLLGNFAKEKAQFIDDKSRILTCVHPSPLARGFVGSGIFQKVEEKLGKMVDWNI
jgi:uracil-DNA glycosylase